MMRRVPIDRTRTRTRADALGGTSSRALLLALAIVGCGDAGNDDSDARAPSAAEPGPRAATWPLREVEAPDGIDEATWARQVLTRAHVARFVFRAITPDQGTFEADNPAHDLRAIVDGTHARLTDALGEADVHLRIVGLGRGATSAFADEAPVALGECPDAERVDLRGECAARLELRHAPGVVEWWTNDERGLEHGLTLDDAPAGEGPLRVALRVSAAEVVLDDDRRGATLRSSRGRALRYAGLHAWDARGTALQAHMERVDEGLAWVVQDAGAVYPIVIDPIVTTVAWRGESDQAEARFGASVVAAGDVDGDGFTDVIVGAPGYDGGQTDEGRVYLFRGNAIGVSTTAAWTFECDRANAALGTVVSSAGDVNGDGFADVAVAAPGYGNGEAEEGAVFVFFGSAGGLPATASQTFEGGQVGAHFGRALAFGDVSGDGFSELAVGAPDFDGGQVDEGRVVVYRGSAAGLVLGGSVEIDQASAAFGSALAFADVTNGGTASLLVGAPLYDGGETNEGRAFRFVVSATGVITSTPAWGVESNQAEARLGASLAAVGVSGAARDLTIGIGAPGYDAGETDEGAVFYYRRSGAELATTAFRTEEGNQAGAAYGTAIAFAGDVDGDGLGDWMVGAPGYDAGQTDEGRVFVYEGAIDDVIAPPTTFESDQASAELGRFVGSAGDVDGDGWSDVIFGAPLFDAGQTNEGRAFVHTGSAGAPLATSHARAISPVAAEDPMCCGGPVAAFAASVGGAGDVNGDGYDDTIVSSFGDGANDDAIYVYHGSPTGPSATPDLSLPSAQVARAGAIGDVNGDGYDDVHYGNAGFGSTRILLGSPTGLTSGGTLTGAYQHLAAAGDVNGDGYDDLLAANAFDGLDTGRAYLLAGSATGLVGTPVWNRAGTVPSGLFGFALAGVGDVNGDGYDDAAFSTPEYSNGQSREGRLEIFYGGPTWFGSAPDVVVESDCANGELGYVRGGFNEADGPTIAGGDIDGNGRSDIVASSRCGQVFVFRSGPDGVLDGFTREAVAVGHNRVALLDVNGDGYADLLTGAAGAPTVRFGSPTGLGLVAQTYAAEDGSSTLFDIQTTLGRIGDLDGDGYEDFVTRYIGAPAGRSFGEGVSFYLGGGGLAPLSTRLGVARLTRPSTTTSVTAGGRSTSSRGADVRWTAPFAAAGRTRVDLERDGRVVSEQPAFDGARARAGSWRASDSASLVSNFDATTTPSDDTAHRFRVRLAYDPAQQVAVPHSRWRYFAPRGSATFRTAACPEGASNGAGSCDACSAGYYGPACDACDPAVNCSGNGTCSDAGGGACVCDASFTGATCDTCVAGRAGPSCEFSDAVDCNGHGTAQFDGSCVCSAGFAGASCETCAADRYGYPTCTFCQASTTCSGHGSCTGTGACACAAAYTGASCDACGPNRYGYPTCTFCEASTTCMGRGTCSATGACVCGAGFAGATCQYSDATTCNGRGTAQSDGSCVCGASFAGATCASCAAGRAGSTCQYSDAVTCNGRGTAQFDGSCVCSAGFTGARCEFSASDTCNDHGAAQPDGSCICSTGFTGATCNACATNYYAYPTCAFCSAATTCGGRGTCTATGACACAAGFAGSSCQYSDATTCNGHGTARADGTCACAAGFTNAACDACAPGFIDYPACTGCTDAVTCNGHGTCSATGCECAPGFAGAGCDTCAPGFVGYPSCAACDADITCRGRGTCAAGGGCDCADGFAGAHCEFSRATTCGGRGTPDDAGNCTCDDGFTGRRCEACVAGRFAFPGCRLCDPAVTCGGRGTCAADGTCACEAGFAGASCELSRATTCSGNGTPNDDGSCTCDAGSAGARCQFSRATTCNGNGTPQASGACLCDRGFTGSTCSLSAGGTCNGHGRVNDDGSCACDRTFTGERCDACEPDHYDYPRCVFCDLGTCNFGGTCAADGSCTCSLGRAGRFCELSDLENCNGLGRVQNDASCICSAGSAGPTCEYTREATCSGHGDPQNDGSCRCFDGFVGSRCQWDNVAQCGHHGDAQEDGSCVCDTNFAGTSCAECVTNQYPLNRCDVFCEASTTCNGRGACNANGACACEEGWVGSACQYSNDTTCNGHGTASFTGSCTCDVGWAGTSCDRCATDYYGGECETFCNETETCNGNGACMRDGTCLCTLGSTNPSCEACPEGSYCPRNATTPLECAAGTYAHGAGRDFGRFVTVGDYFCAPCAAGTFALAGSDECTRCPDMPDGNPCTRDTCNVMTGEPVYERVAGCTTCGDSRNVCDRELGESCSTCARDCGVCPVCGDGICADTNSDPTLVETCWNCAEDCSTCPADPARPAMPVDPTRPTGTTIPTNDPTLTCSGTPRLSTVQPFEINAERIRFETPEIAGRRASLTAFANVDYNHYFKQLDAEQSAALRSQANMLTSMCMAGDTDCRRRALARASQLRDYAYNPNMCHWELRGEAGLKGCVETSRGVAVQSSCREIGLYVAGQCEQFPVCGSTGYTCELGDVSRAMCTMDMGGFYRQSLGFSVRKDFGPFFAEGSINFSAGVEAGIGSSWGSAVSPDGGAVIVDSGNPCAPEALSYSYVRLRADATARLAAGVTLGGFDFSFGASATACIGVTFRGNSGCMSASPEIEGGFEVTAQTPSLDLGIYEFGPYRITYDGDTGGCE